MAIWSPDPTVDGLAVDGPEAARSRMSHPGGPSHFWLEWVMARKARRASIGQESNSTGLMCFARHRRRIASQGPWAT